MPKADEVKDGPVVEQIVETPQTETEVAFLALQKTNTDLWEFIAHNSPSTVGEQTRAFYQRYLEIEQQLGSAIAAKIAANPAA